MSRVNERKKLVSADETQTSGIHITDTTQSQLTEGTSLNNQSSKVILTLARKDSTKVGFKLEDYEEKNDTLRSQDLSVGQPHTGKETLILEQNHCEAQSSFQVGKLSLESSMCEMSFQIKTGAESFGPSPIKKRTKFDNETHISSKRETPRRQHHLSQKRSNSSLFNSRKNS